MSMQWFVLNTLTGQEQKVQKLLKAKAAEGEVDLTASIGETLMPTERVTTRIHGSTKAAPGPMPGTISTTAENPSAWWSAISTG